MVTPTYAGTTLAIADALPANETESDFIALAPDFKTGVCALHTVPALARTWASVSDPLVCRKTNSSVKGSATWDDVTFPLSHFPEDEAQVIYRQYENSRDGVASFRMTLPGARGASFYFTAQVGKFALVDGGGQDDRIAATVMLMIQSEEIIRVIPAA